VILVCAATGNVGSCVVAELRRRNVSLRAFARDAGRVHDMLGDGIEVAIGDFSDIGAIERALNGVDAVFLASANHPDQTQHETNVIDAAASAGVDRIVKLSNLGAAIGSRLDFSDCHGRIEQHLKASQISATLLRPSFFMSNLLMVSDQIARTGRLSAAAGEGKISMVDPRDVAACAAVCLTDDGHADQTYTLTGPEVLTYTDVAQRLSTVLGWPVEYVSVADDVLRYVSLQAGMSEWFADNLVTLFQLLREGAASQVTDTVEALIKQPPRDFATFARDYSIVFAPMPA
jgi:uncharacterized protein YbjT (DUF2867 family)